MTATTTCPAWCTTAHPGSDVHLSPNRYVETLNGRPLAINVSHDSAGRTVIGLGGQELSPASAVAALQALTGTVEQALRLNDSDLAPALLEFAVNTTGLALLAEQVAR